MWGDTANQMILSQFKLNNNIPNITSLNKNSNIRPILNKKRHLGPRHCWQLLNKMGKSIGYVNLDNTQFNIEENEPPDSMLASKVTEKSGKLTIQHFALYKFDEILRPIKHHALTELVLSHNQLCEVPSCLYTGFQHLQLLDLSFNHIQWFEIEPACVLTIKVFKINDNKMDSLPLWILKCKCPNLQEVLYSNNSLTDLYCDSVCNIRKIVMCNTNLADVDFRYFKKLHNLEYLDIGNSAQEKARNHFNDLDKLFVRARWKNLLVLKLNNLMVSIFPEGILNLVTLKELYLSGCALSWIPSDIGRLINLQILDISFNKICALPVELTLLESLKAVDLYSNSLDDFPGRLYQLEFIDFEMNFYDTTTSQFYLDYKTKRDEWRRRCSYDGRFNNIRKPIMEFHVLSSNLSEDEASIDSEDDSCDAVEDLPLGEKLEADDENWDEDSMGSQTVVVERHPDITPSDDEWTGDERIITKKRAPQRLKPLVYEDWIFCDVEE